MAFADREALAAPLCANSSRNNSVHGARAGSRNNSVHGARTPLTGGGALSVHAIGKSSSVHGAGHFGGGCASPPPMHRVRSASGTLAEGTFMSVFSSGPAPALKAQRGGSHHGEMYMARQLAAMAATGRAVGEGQTVHGAQHFETLLENDHDENTSFTKEKHTLADKV